MHKSTSYVQRRTSGNPTTEVSGVDTLSPWRRKESHRVKKDTQGLSSECSRAFWSDRDLSGPSEIGKKLETGVKTYRHGDLGEPFRSGDGIGSTPRTPKRPGVPSRKVRLDP